MSFQVEIGSLVETVFFSGETLYPSANYEILSLIFKSVNLFLEIAV